ncbi:ATP-binding protein [Streptomyces wuyuanensis]|uniref:ATP-binding protein n=1 Tax=Streptomyces wuyuanensis TaxID=1196353 RepID=UPI0037BA20D3
MVINQLTNALKFVPAGGSVILTLRQDRDRAELRVIDTGPGIPAEELPRIFDRFFRSRAARAGGTAQAAGSGGGSGIGLAAELATAHGGTITSDSTPGHGTTFTTRLPAVDR